MPSIRSGLGDCVDDATRMQAIAGRQRAGLHAELRQRIRKRERHIHIGEAVVIVSAVEQVVGGIARAARNRDGLGTEEALAAGVGSIAVIDGRAGDRNELCRIAAIEGQVHDALLIDDLRNRILLRLHQAGVGIHLDPFRHRSHSHRDVDLGVVVDSQNNAALDVGLKPCDSRFERVGADRQAWERIDAVCVSDRAVNPAPPVSTPVILI